MNKRILLKISGESLMGSSNYGIDVSTINKISKLLTRKGLIVFENYSHLKGINVNFDLINKKLDSSFYCIKFIKFPNQLFWTYSLKMSKKFYRLLSFFLKFFYYLINRQPTFYVILIPKKKDELVSFPNMIHIEPTNHCNLGCIMCPQPREMQRVKGMMNFDLINL